MPFKIDPIKSKTSKVVHGNSGGSIGQRCECPRTEIGGYGLTTAKEQLEPRDFGFYSVRYQWGFSKNPLVSDTIKSKNIIFFWIFGFYRVDFEGHFWKIPFKIDGLRDKIQGFWDTNVFFRLWARRYAYAGKRAH